MSKYHKSFILIEFERGEKAGKYLKYHVRTPSIHQNINISLLLTLIALEGSFYTIFENFWKKWPFSRNNNTALIKQISLFDTALVMANT